MKYRWAKKRQRKGLGNDANNPNAFQHRWRSVGLQSLVLIKSGTGLFPVSPTCGRTFQRDIGIDVYGIYSGFDTLSLGLCLRAYPKIYVLQYTKLYYTYIRTWWERKGRCEERALYSIVSYIHLVWDVVQFTRVKMTNLITLCNLYMYVAYWGEKTCFILIWKVTETRFVLIHSMSV